MRRSTLGIIGVLATFALISTGCGASSSGNTTAAVGHDGKEHGQVKAQSITANYPAARKGAPRR